METSYKDILGLKISDDVLATIAITFCLFIVGGLAKWIYDSKKNNQEKKTIKGLVNTSIKLMEERINKQVEELNKFSDVLKNKNLKDLNLSSLYPYQLKAIFTIPSNDLYITYRKNEKKYNDLITNIYLIDSIFLQLVTLYKEIKDKLDSYQDDWYKLVIEFRNMYDKNRTEGDAFYNSIRPLYVEWATNVKTKDLESALKFFNNFIVECRNHLTDKRALPFLHLANDITNIIRNYQGKTVFYSGVIDFYKNILNRAYTELKNATV